MLGDGLYSFLEEIPGLRSTLLELYQQMAMLFVFSALTLAFRHFRVPTIC